MAHENSPASVPGVEHRGGDGVPSVERTYVLQSVVGWRKDGADAGTILRDAARIALKWCDAKIPGPLTERMYALQSDTLDQFGIQGMRTVSDLDSGVWAAQVRYTDRPRERNYAVPGRTWTSEIVLRAQGGQVRCGIQMFMAKSPGADGKLTYDRPSLVDGLEAELGLTDYARMSPAVTRITANHLYDFAISLKRVLPLVVLTQPKSSHVGFPYGVETQAFGRQMLGIAWVVSLTQEETFQWRERAGVRWAVFGGAVLVLEPGWHPVTETHDRRRRYFFDWIEDWEYRGDRGEEGFRRFLAESCTRKTAKSRFELPPELRFDQVRTADIGRRRSLANYGELLPLAEEEIGVLKGEVNDLRQRLDTALDERETARIEALDAQEKVEQLRAYCTHWRNIAERRESVLVPESRPTTLREIARWATKFEGRLLLLPRAERSLKDGLYEDVELVCKAIEMLADEGYDFHSGSASGKERLEAKCAELGLSFGGAISDSRAGEEGETYFVTYPASGNERRKLEFHLKKGTSHDPRYCLRIYYFWDEVGRCVVVGSLPAHLDNSLS